ncbi:MAG: DUF4178 domain-containing protein [Cardiobacteriaceae bacterium]|nr:DUF4178 domain-containing protein [Cardiobacteriaceae bacterium]
MNAPLFKTDCPSCGAPVAVHSATAVTLVCDYCHSLLLRHDNTLSDTGRDSALLEDFSPLQVGTTGKLGDMPFTLIGRLQAQYDAGVWNEWHALFADGSTGWLSEAGDLYVFLRPVAAPAEAPSFTEIVAGHTTLDYEGKDFRASDVREIMLSRTAAQGELPFVVPERMENRVADFRCENHFLTLDYAENLPEAFYGHGVTLDGLHLQNTRDDAQILATAGKLKGARSAASCPNCGSQVEWVSGATSTLICRSCASTLDTSGDKAELVEAGKYRESMESRLTLPLGTQGEINGKRYVVIGVVKKNEVDIELASRALRHDGVRHLGAEGSWTEYLLYHPERGFLWLVETEDGEWSISRTLNEWPRLNRKGNPQGASLLYEYGSQVSYAAGAFYWRIRHGDILLHRDFSLGSNKKLGAEQSADELAWSESHPVSTAQMAKWFGKAFAPALARQDDKKRTLPLFLIAFFLFLNVPAWLNMNSDNLAFSIFVSGIVIYLLHKLGKGKHE